MEVRFTTKEESNRERERAFLALSPSERVVEFLRLSRRIMREYPSSRPRDYGDDLVLERRGPRAGEATGRSEDAGS